MPDVSATIAGLDALAERITAATKDIVGDAAHILQAAGMVNAPVGTPGNTTNLPGDLRRSIVVEGPEQVAEGSFGARVGPTVIYGRQRELGGAIYPVRARLLRFRRFGQLEFRHRVYQHPEPYMKPAYEESRSPIWAMTIARLTAAIEGG